MIATTFGLPLIVVLLSCCSSLGCYEEAIQHCLQTGSRSQEVLCLLGFCYGKLGESSEALKGAKN